MPIRGTDIAIHLSQPAAAAGLSAPAEPAESRGGFVATTLLDEEHKRHNLFGPVTGDANAERAVDDRCVFVHNTHERLTLLDARVWVRWSQGATRVAVGVDPTPASPARSSSRQAVSEPAAVSFTIAEEKLVGLHLGDLPPGHVRAIWVRREATDSAATDDDGVIIAVEGDTSE